MKQFQTQFHLKKSLKLLSSLKNLENFISAMRSFDLCLPIHTRFRACHQNSTETQHTKRIIHNLGIMFSLERVLKAQLFPVNNYQRINFPHRTKKEIIKWLGSLLLFTAVVLVSPVIKSFLLCVLLLSLIRWHTHATSLGFNNLLSNTITSFAVILSSIFRHCWAALCTASHDRSFSPFHKHETAKSFDWKTRSCVV